MNDLTEHWNDERWVTLGDGFATAHDTPRERATLGYVVGPRSSSALALDEYLVRGDRVLGRFSQSPATLGLVVEESDEPARLEIRLLFDEPTERWWRERVAGLGEAGQDRLDSMPGPPPLDGDPDGPGSWYEASSMRLLRIATPRVGAGFCLLTPRASAGGQASSYGLGVLTLPAGHMVEGGLLPIRVADVTRPGLRLVDGARHGAVGLQLLQIRVESAEEFRTMRPGSPTIDAGTAERAGWISTGGGDSRFAPGPRRLASGALIVGGSEPEGCTGIVLTVDPQGVEGETDIRRAIMSEEVSSQSLDEQTPVSFALDDHSSGGLILRRTHPASVTPAVVRLPSHDPAGRRLLWTVRGLEVDPTSRHFNHESQEAGATRPRGAGSRARRLARRLSSAS